VRTKWAIERSILWVILGVVAIAIGLGTNTGGLTIGAGAATVVILVMTVGSAFLSWRFWSWATHEDALELEHGILIRHLSVVPYHRIQQIDIKRDPLERILGLSTLILRSAAATTDAHVPGIAAEDTEQLRHALLARAGVDDAV